MREAAMGVPMVAKLQSATPEAMTFLGLWDAMSNPHGMIATPYPKENTEDICPLTVSARWYSVERGRMATDMATRSKAERRATTQHSDKMGR
mmetsp:Transcript_8411/g.12360  ORF Transcript_8411/g.12360 Transcript_8411/m.12360 type:complete len:92 (+) Transcript_8411:23-298(+)